MRSIKNTFRLLKAGTSPDSRTFWMSQSPEERVEAVETIREHYYQMLGYNEPPRIKKIITIT